MNSALALPYFISHAHVFPVVSISHAHLHNCAGHMVALFLMVYLLLYLLLISPNNVSLVRESEFMTF